MRRSSPVPTLALALATLAGCARDARPEAPRPQRLWVQESRALPEGARPFAVATRARGIAVTATGSWSEPLAVEGEVLDTGRRTDPALPARTARWNGRHQIALRNGDERIVVQYDAPVPPAAPDPGERVRLFAHSMSTGRHAVSSMAILDADGRLELMGFRSPDPDRDRVLLPHGWSVARGPVVRHACGDRHPERAVRVRGPAGEIVVEAGRSAVARLGASGARYAVDVQLLRPAHQRCRPRGGGGELSVVVRRLPDGGRLGARLRSRASM